MLCVTFLFGFLIASLQSQIELENNRYAGEEQRRDT